MGNKIKRRYLWLILFFVVCLFLIFKSTTLDINSVKAAVLKQVVKIDRDNTEVCRFLAGYYDGSGNFKESATYWNQLAQKEPYVFMNWQKLGDAYASNCQYEMAIKAYNTAVKINPESAWNHILLAFTYKDMHRCNEAIDELKKAYEVDPDKTDLSGIMGLFYFEAEQYDDAILAYKKYLMGHPNNKADHYNLGKAYLQVGNKDLAMEEYQILKTLDEKMANELLTLIKEALQ